MAWYEHFNSIDSSSSWTWDFFPRLFVPCLIPSSVFNNCKCASLSLFVSFFLSIIFHYNCEWDHLLNFSIEWLVGLYIRNWFVCSNFVSCSFAEFISSNLFSMHMIMSSASRSNFLFSFSDWDIFYFLSNCTEQNFQYFVDYEWQECLSLLCTRFYYLFICTRF